MDNNGIFETFAIVEIFGHTRIAGRVSEQIIAGNGFLRVDVPELPAAGRYPMQPAFTRLYGTAAIYSITPVSEEIAMQAAQSMRVRPVDVYIAVPQLAEALDDDDYDIEKDYDDEE
jgi:hypothetical protein